MKKIILSIIILPILLLTGCANINLTDEQVDNFDWVQQANAFNIAIDYHNLRTRGAPHRLITIESFAWSYADIDPRVLTYYEKALVIKGLDPEHVQLIRKGEICVGMREFGMYAAWGRPRENNTHQSAYGKSIQHIYGSITASKYSSLARKYVYTKNGIITSFSVKE
jgi:hypothetical protein